MNGEPYSRTHCHGLNQRGNATLAALGGVAVGVILVLLTWLVVLMTKDDPATRAATTPPSTPAVVASVPVSVTTRTVVPKPSGKGTSNSAPAVGDVRSLAGGLFCRDLNAKGYSYVAAIDYWRLHGQPNQMDADRNGIPCETVYPRSDVGQYWNGREIGSGAPLASGLLCRDLAARG